MSHAYARASSVGTTGQSDPGRKKIKKPTQFSKEEHQQQAQLIEDHCERMVRFAHKHGLNLDGRAGRILYDTSCLTEEEAAWYGELGVYEEHSLLSSLIRKQNVVLQACKIRKERPIEVGAANGGFPKELRRKLNYDRPQHR